MQTDVLTDLKVSGPFIAKAANPLETSKDQEKSHCTSQELFRVESWAGGPRKYWCVLGMHVLIRASGVL